MSTLPVTAVSLIRAHSLTLAYGDTLVQADLSFEVDPGTVFAIMGPSGCGKSTLLRSLIGLHRPTSGCILFDGKDFWGMDEPDRNGILQQAGVLFQGAALWSSMTVAENVALPLQLFTDLSPALIADQVAFKLALVGLADAAEFYPSAISGGMRKRAGLARALALDPRVLFLDEPTAGLDPPSAQRLDALILRLRDTLGVTVVLVTHELESLFAIADDSLFLDAETKTAIDRGPPRELQAYSEHARVREFLNPQGTSVS